MLNHITFQLLSLPVVFFSLFLLVSSASAATYYVDPNGSDFNAGTSVESAFRTIQKARDTVRGVNMTSDITVYLRGGFHPQSSTLTFDARDSGKNGYNIIYSSYPGDASPIVSGGVRIPSSWIPLGRGIYKTNVGDLSFRQLYVNGQRAIRARTPNKGSKYWTKSWDLVNKQVIINASEISNWARLNEVELVNLHQFQQANLRIASFSLSGNDAIVVPQEPERSEVVLQASLISMWTIRKKTAVNAYYFENAYEFLDSPGEWYLNPGTNELYYMPRAGEDMTTASVVAPVLEPTLVEIQGTLDAPVHNLHFYGITFAHSNWTQPSRQGLVMVQAVEIFDNNSLSTMPPAISVRNANNLRFERNIFEDVGATGLGLWSGTHDNVIIGNVFRDIAGTGLAIMQRQWNPVDYREVSQRDAVINNYFVRIGQDYRDSVGIFAGLPDSAHIEHNELFDMPYTGISIGWRWDASPTQAKNNLIRYNRLHELMKEMSDGGGIYTLGSMPGTYLTENYSYDFARSTWAGDWPNAGFYIDDGGADLTLENNVADNVPMGIWLGGGTVRNTVINFAGSIEPSRDPAPTLINNGNINRDAIRANAGIELAYADIISGGGGRGGDGVPVSTAPSDFRYRPCHELRTDMSVSNDEYYSHCRAHSTTD